MEESKELEVDNTNIKNQEIEIINTKYLLFECKR